jgi:hypothetical protein
MLDLAETVSPYGTHPAEAIARRAAAERYSMPKTAYCWRCKLAVPMLDEQEWEQVLPHLESRLRSGLRDVYGQGALTRYFEITGFRETNVNAIWHHRLSQFGPPCPSCGKLLRTPRAKLCAECGVSVR